MGNNPKKMAFTASEIPNTLAYMDNVVGSNHAGYAENNYPTPVLEAMLASQNPENVVETLQNGTCVGVDAWFYEVGAHLAPAAVPDPVVQGCDLVDGSEGATRAKTYENTRIGFASFKVTGPKCNNAVDRQMEMARLMVKAQADIRKQLQKKYYDTFTGNVQVNQDTSDATFFASATGGNRLAVATGSWNFELLRRMKLLADNNLHPENRLYINGHNLWLDGDLAQFRALNDDARDEAAVFGDSRIFWDTRTMDAHLGRRSTFIVNPGNFLFHNTTVYSTIGETVTRGGKEYTTFAVADSSGLRFNMNGTMMPVMYQVEVEIDCSGRNKLSQRIDTILVNVSAIGILDIGPTGYNNPVDVATAPTQVITGVNEIVYEDPA